jgi:general secretion pathway protein E
VLQQGPGCERCQGGNAGRTVVAEVLPMDKSVKELVYARASNLQIVDAARKGGFKTMTDNGLALLLKGDATLKEIEATVGPVTLGKSKRKGGNS